jgi:hypothetical protein
MQGVCGLRKVSVVNLSKALKDCCCRCAQSRKELNTWKCLRIVARSACKDLLEDSELCEAQEGQGFQVHRGEAQGVCTVECLNRRCKVTRRRTSFHRGILGSPRRNHQRGRDRWLGPCGEDLQNPASHWICQRTKEVTTVFRVQALGVMIHWIIDQLPISHLI